MNTVEGTAAVAPVDIQGLEKFSGSTNDVLRKLKEEDKLSEVAKPLLQGGSFTSAQSARNTIQHLDVVCQVHGKMEGTGFLIAPGLLLTNHHIIPDKPWARRTQVTFFYEEGREPKEYVAVGCNVDEENSFFYSSPTPDKDGYEPLREGALDFTIVALQPDPQLDRIYQKALTIFSKAEPAEGRDANIIQHPLLEEERTTFKQLALNKVGHVDKPYEIHYHTLTLPGSSGAPVINAQGNVYGLHRAKCQKHEKCNRAITISAIAKEICDKGLKETITNRRCSSNTLGVEGSSGVEKSLEALQLEGERNRLSGGDPTVGKGKEKAKEGEKEPEMETGRNTTEVSEPRLRDLAVQLFERIKEKPGTLQEYYTQKQKRAEEKYEKLKKAGKDKLAREKLALKSKCETALSSLQRQTLSLDSGKSLKTLELALIMEAPSCLPSLERKNLLHLRALALAILSNQRGNLIALKKIMRELDRKKYSKEDYFVRGFVLKTLNKEKKAAKSYLELAKMFRRENHLEGESACSNEAVSLNSTLLLDVNTPLAGFPGQQQSLIRIAFEKQIEKINEKAEKSQKPVCYIAYAWGAKETEDWFTSTEPSFISAREWIKTKLLADLELAGIQTLFDVRDAEKEYSRMDYIEKIATSDYVLLICTPEARKQYENWKVQKDNAGIGQEITLAHTRFNSSELRKTVFPLIYEGNSLTEVNPIIITHDVLPFDFREPKNYYVECLKLCGKLRQGQIATLYYVDQFKKEALKVLQKTQITPEEEATIEKWRSEGGKDI